MTVWWLFEGFEKLGWVPAPPDIGMLEPLKNPSPEVLANQLRFVAYWAATRARLANLGWKRITTGSRIELYLQDNDGAVATDVIVDPSVGGRFRMPGLCAGVVGASTHGARDG